MIPILPEKGDVHPAYLRPSGRKEGRYRIYRDPFDTEIKVEEPDGSSYLLEAFEFETFLRITMRTPEERASRILNMVWNFGIVEFRNDNLDEAIFVPRL